MAHASAELDRRISSRLEVGFSVECLGGGVSGPCKAELDNVSRTGVFVWMDRELEKGTRLELLLTPEAELAALGEEPFRMLIEVVRRVEEGERVGYGCILLQTSLEDEPEIDIAPLPIP